ncbi:20669_t:CDS:2, partial [Racocetra persica]
YEVKGEEILVAKVGQRKPGEIDDVYGGYHPHPTTTRPTITQRPQARDFSRKAKVNNYHRLLSNGWNNNNNLVTRTQKIKNLVELEKFSQFLIPLLKPNVFLILQGELGVGKTTLTQLIAKNLGIREKRAAETKKIQLQNKITKEITYDQLKIESKQKDIKGKIDIFQRLTKLEEEIKNKENKTASDQKKLESLEMIKKEFKQSFEAEENPKLVEGVDYCVEDKGNGFKKYIILSEKLKADFRRFNHGQDFGDITEQKFEVLPENSEEMARKIREGNEKHRQKFIAENNPPKLRYAFLTPEDETLSFIQKNRQACSDTFPDENFAWDNEFMSKIEKPGTSEHKALQALKNAGISLDKLFEKVEKGRKIREKKEREKPHQDKAKILANIED